MGLLRVTLIAVLLAAHVMCGTPGWLHPGCSPYLARALSYHFFHASWWHLAVNCLAVWSVYRPGLPCKPCRDLVIPFLIASLVYPLSFRPVIGFSNMLYAAIGLRTPPLRSPWWRSSPVITFAAVTAALAVIPRISATTHIAAFALGVAAACLGRKIKSLENDAGIHG